MDMTIASIDKVPLNKEERAVADQISKQAGSSPPVDSSAPNEPSEEKGMDDRIANKMGVSKKFLDKNKPAKENEAESKPETELQIDIKPENENKGRAEQREKRLADFKKRNAELKADYDKAVKEKDEISKKLIEREYADLERTKREIASETFFEQASKEVQNVNHYRESYEYYGPIFKKYPALIKAVANCGKPHAVVYELCNYFDRTGFDPKSTLAKLNDRAIALTVKQLDNAIAQMSNSNNTEPRTETKTAIPKAVVASTPGESGVPEVPKNDRHAALLHFRKYGSKKGVPGKKYD